MKFFSFILFFIFISCVTASPKTSSFEVLPANFAEKGAPGCVPYLKTCLNLEESKKITLIVTDVKGDDETKAISVSLTKPSHEELRALTASMIGRPLAIRVDKKIVSVPVVRAELIGPKFELTLADELDYRNVLQVLQ